MEDEHMYTQDAGEHASLPVAENSTAPLSSPSGEAASSHDNDDLQQQEQQQQQQEAQEEARTQQLQAEAEEEAEADAASAAAMAAQAEAEAEADEQDAAESVPQTEPEASPPSEQPSSHTADSSAVTESITAAASSDSTPSIPPVEVNAESPIPPADLLPEEAEEPAAPLPPVSFGLDVLRDTWEAVDMESAPKSKKTRSSSSSSEASSFLWHTLASIAKVCETLQPLPPVLETLEQERKAAEEAAAAELAAKEAAAAAAAAAEQAQAQENGGSEEAKEAVPAEAAAPPALSPVAEGDGSARPIPSDGQEEEGEDADVDGPEDPEPSASASSDQKEGPSTERKQEAANEQKAADGKTTDPIADEVKVDMHTELMQEEQKTGEGEETKEEEEGTETKVESKPDLQPLPANLASSDVLLQLLAMERDLPSTTEESKRTTLRVLLLRLLLHVCTPPRQPLRSASTPATTSDYHARLSQSQHLVVGLLSEEKSGVLQQLMSFLDPLMAELRFLDPQQPSAAEAKKDKAVHPAPTWGEGQKRVAMLSLAVIDTFAAQVVGACLALLASSTDSSSPSSPSSSSPSPDAHSTLKAMRNLLSFTHAPAVTPSSPVPPPSFTLFSLSLHLFLSTDIHPLDALYSHHLRSLARTLTLHLLQLGGVPLLQGWALSVNTWAEERRRQSSPSPSSPDGSEPEALLLTPRDRVEYTLEVLFQLLLPLDAHPAPPSDPDADIEPADEEGETHILPFEMGLTPVVMPTKAARKLFTPQGVATNYIVQQLDAVRMFGALVAPARMGVLAAAVAEKKGSRADGSPLRPSSSCFEVPPSHSHVLTYLLTLLEPSFLLFHLPSSDKDVPPPSTKEQRGLDRASKERLVLEHQARTSIKKEYWALILALCQVRVRKQEGLHVPIPPPPPADPNLVIPLQPMSPSHPFPLSTPLPLQRTLFFHKDLLKHMALLMTSDRKMRVYAMQLVLHAVYLLEDFEVEMREREERESKRKRAGDVAAHEQELTSLLISSRQLLSATLLTPLFQMLHTVFSEQHQLHTRLSPLAAQVHRQHGMAEIERGMEVLSVLFQRDAATREAAAQAMPGLVAIMKLVWQHEAAMSEPNSKADNSSSSSTPVLPVFAPTPRCLLHFAHLLSHFSLSAPLLPSVRKTLLDPSLLSTVVDWMFEEQYWDRWGLTRQIEAEAHQTCTLEQIRLAFMNALEQVCMNCTPQSVRVLNDKKVVSKMIALLPPPPTEEEEDNDPLPDSALSPSTFALHIYLFNSLGHLSRVSEVMLLDATRFPSSWSLLSYLSSTLHRYWVTYRRVNTAINQLMKPELVAAAAEGKAEEEEEKGRRTQGNPAFFVPPTTSSSAYPWLDAVSSSVCAPDTKQELASLLTHQSCLERLLRAGMYATQQVLERLDQEATENDKEGLFGPVEAMQANLEMFVGEVTLPLSTPPLHPAQLSRAPSASPSKPPSARRKTGMAATSLLSDDSASDASAGGKGSVSWLRHGAVGVLRVQEAAVEIMHVLAHMLMDAQQSKGEDNEDKKEEEKKEESKEATPQTASLLAVSLLSVLSGRNFIMDTMLPLLHAAASRSSSAATSSSSSSSSSTPTFSVAYLQSHLVLRRRVAGFLRLLSGHPDWLHNCWSTSSSPSARDVSSAAARRGTWSGLAGPVSGEVVATRVLRKVVDVMEVEVTAYLQEQVQREKEGKGSSTAHAMADDKKPQTVFLLPRGGAQQTHVPHAVFAEEDEEEDPLHRHGYKLLFRQVALLLLNLVCYQSQLDEAKAKRVVNGSTHSAYSSAASAATHHPTLSCLHSLLPSSLCLLQHSVDSSLRSCLAHCLSLYPLIGPKQDGTEYLVHEMVPISLSKSLLEELQTDNKEQEKDANAPTSNLIYPLAPLIQYSITALSSSSPSTASSTEATQLQAGLAQCIAKVVRRALTVWGTEAEATVSHSMTMKQAPTSDSTPDPMPPARRAAINKLINLIGGQRVFEELLQAICFHADKALHTYGFYLWALVLQGAARFAGVAQNAKGEDASAPPTAADNEFGYTSSAPAPSPSSSSAADWPLLVAPSHSSLSSLFPHSWSWATAPAPSPTPSKSTLSTLVHTAVHDAMSPLSPPPLLHSAWSVLVALASDPSNHPALLYWLTRKFRAPNRYKVTPVQPHTYWQFLTVLAHRPLPKSKQATGVPAIPPHQRNLLHRLMALFINNFLHSSSAHVSDKNDTLDWLLLRPLPGSESQYSLLDLSVLTRLISVSTGIGMKGGNKRVLDSELLMGVFRILHHISQHSAQTCVQWLVGTSATEGTTPRSEAGVAHNRAASASGADSASSRLKDPRLIATLLALTHHAALTSPNSDPRLALELVKVLLAASRWEAVRKEHKGWEAWAQFMPFLANMATLHANRDGAVSQKICEMVTKALACMLCEESPLISGPPTKADLARIENRARKWHYFLAKEGTSAALRSLLSLSSTCPRTAHLCLVLLNSLFSLRGHPAHEQVVLPWLVKVDNLRAAIDAVIGVANNSSTKEEARNDATKMLPLATLMHNLFLIFERAAAAAAGTVTEQLAGLAEKLFSVPVVQLLLGWCMQPEAPISSPAASPVARVSKDPKQTTPSEAAQLSSTLGPHLPLPSSPTSSSLWLSLQGWSCLLVISRAHSFLDRLLLDGQGGGSSFIHQVARVFVECFAKKSEEDANKMLPPVRTPKAAQAQTNQITSLKQLSSLDASTLLCMGSRHLLALACLACMGHDTTIEASAEQVSPSLLPDPRDSERRGLRELRVAFVEQGGVQHMLHLFASTSDPTKIAPFASSSLHPLSPQLIGSLSGHLIASWSHLPCVVRCLHQLCPVLLMEESPGPIHTEEGGEQVAWAIAHLREEIFAHRVHQAVQYLTAVSKQDQDHAPKQAGQEEQDPNSTSASLSSLDDTSMVERASLHEQVLNFCARILSPPAKQSGLDDPLPLDPVLKALLILKLSSTAAWQFQRGQAQQQQHGYDQVDMDRRSLLFQVLGEQTPIILLQLSRCADAEEEEVATVHAMLALTLVHLFSLRAADGSKVHTDSEPAAPSNFLTHLPLFLSPEQKVLPPILGSRGRVMVEEKEDAETASMQEHRSSPTARAPNVQALFDLFVELLSHSDSLPPSTLHPLVETFSRILEQVAQNGWDFTAEVVEDPESAQDEAQKERRSGSVVPSFPASRMVLFFRTLMLLGTGVVYSAAQLADTDPDSYFLLRSSIFHSLCALSQRRSLHCFMVPAAGDATSLESGGGWLVLLCRFLEREHVRHAFPSSSTDPALSQGQMHVLLLIVKNLVAANEEVMRGLQDAANISTEEQRAMEEEFDPTLPIGPTTPATGRLRPLQLSAVLYGFLSALCAPAEEDEDPEEVAEREQGLSPLRRVVLEVLIGVEGAAEAESIAKPQRGEAEEQGETFESERTCSSILLLLSLLPSLQTDRGVMHLLSLLLLQLLHPRSSHAPLRLAPFASSTCVEHALGARVLAQKEPLEPENADMRDQNLRQMLEHLVYVTWEWVQGGAQLDAQAQQPQQQQAPEGGDESHVRTMARHGFLLMMSFIQTMDSFSLLPDESLRYVLTFIFDQLAVSGHPPTPSSSSSSSSHSPAADLTLILRALHKIISSDHGSFVVDIALANPKRMLFRLCDLPLLRQMRANNITPNHQAVEGAEGATNDVNVVNASEEAMHRLRLLSSILCRFTRPLVQHLLVHGIEVQVSLMDLLPSSTDTEDVVADDTDHDFVAETTGGPFRFTTRDLQERILPTFAWVVWRWGAVANLVEEAAAATTFSNPAAKKSKKHAEAAASSAPSLSRLGDSLTAPWLTTYGSPLPRRIQLAFMHQLMAVLDATRAAPIWVSGSPLVAPSAKQQQQQGYTSTDVALLAILRYLVLQAWQDKYALLQADYRKPASVAGSAGEPLTPSEVLKLKGMTTVYDVLMSFQSLESPAVEAGTDDSTFSSLSGSTPSKRVNKMRQSWSANGSETLLSSGESSTEGSVLTSGQAAIISASATHLAANMMHYFTLMVSAIANSPAADFVLAAARHSANASTASSATSLAATSPLTGGLLLSRLCHMGFFTRVLHEGWWGRVAPLNGDLLVLMRVRVYASGGAAHLQPGASANKQLPFTPLPPPSFLYNETLLQTLLVLLYSPNLYPRTWRADACAILRAMSGTVIRWNGFLAAESESITSARSAKGEAQKEAMESPFTRMRRFRMQTEDSPAKDTLPSSSSSAVAASLQWSGSHFVYNGGHPFSVDVVFELLKCWLLDLGDGLGLAGGIPSAPTLPAIAASQAHNATHASGSTIPISPIFLVTPTASSQPANSKAKFPSSKRELHASSMQFAPTASLTSLRSFLRMLHLVCGAPHTLLAVVTGREGGNGNGSSSSSGSLTSAEQDALNSYRTDKKQHAMYLLTQRIEHVLMGVWERHIQLRARRIKNEMVQAAQQDKERMQNGSPPSSNPQPSSGSLSSPPSSSSLTPSAVSKALSLSFSGVGSISGSDLDDLAKPLFDLLVFFSQFSEALQKQYGNNGGENEGDNRNKSETGGQTQTSASPSARERSKSMVNLTPLSPPSGPVRGGALASPLRSPSSTRPSRSMSSGQLLGRSGMSKPSSTAASSAQSSRRGSHSGASQDTTVQQVKREGPAPMPFHTSLLLCFHPSRPYSVELLHSFSRQLHSTSARSGVLRAVLLKNEWLSVMQVMFHIAASFFQPAQPPAPQKKGRHRSAALSSHFATIDEEELKEPMANADCELLLDNLHTPLLHTTPYLLPYASLPPARSLPHLFLFHILDALSLLLNDPVIQSGWVSRLRKEAIDRDERAEQTRKALNAATWDRTHDISQWELPPANMSEEAVPHTTGLETAVRAVKLLLALREGQEAIEQKYSQSNARQENGLASASQKRGSWAELESADLPTTDFETQSNVASAPAARPPMNVARAAAAAAAAVYVSSSPTSPPSSSSSSSPTFSLPSSSLRPLLSQLTSHHDSLLRLHARTLRLTFKKAEEELKAHRKAMRFLPNLFGVGVLGTPLSSSLRKEEYY